MKRLIKKNAELLEAFSYKNDAFEIYKNPTDDEIQKVKDQGTYNSIRGVIYDDGTIYMWPGDILHKQINNYTTQYININYFRFSYDNNEWNIDLHSKYNVKQCIELLKKYEVTLNKIGNTSSGFGLFYSSDPKEKKYICINLDDYRN